MSAATPHARGAHAWLWIAAASLGACSDTVAVGRQGPGEPKLCYSCSQEALDCEDVPTCPPPCPWAEAQWQAYDTCVCETCDGPCGGCPPTLLSSTTIECRSCPSQAILEGGACYEEWIACSAN